MEERFITDEVTNRDVEHESRLRPRDFTEYVGQVRVVENIDLMVKSCLLYTSPSPRDGLLSRMPSSA